MSTDDQNRSSPPLPVAPSLSMRDLTILLIKQYGLHAGCYDLLVEFQIGVGAVGPDPASLTPGAMIGVSKVGLMLARENGPSSVDAALVNPAASSSIAKPKSATKKPAAKTPAAKKPATTKPAAKTKK